MSDQGDQPDQPIQPDLFETWAKLLYAEARMQDDPRAAATAGLIAQTLVLVSLQAELPDIVWPALSDLPPGHPAVARLKDWQDRFERESRTFLLLSRNEALRRPNPVAADDAEES